MKEKLFSKCRRHLGRGEGRKMKCTERRRGKRMRRCKKQQRKEEIGVEGGGNELYRKGEGRA